MGTFLLNKQYARVCVCLRLIYLFIKCNVPLLALFFFYIIIIISVSTIHRMFCIHKEEWIWNQSRPNKQTNNRTQREHNEHIKLECMQLISNIWKFLDRIKSNRPGQLDELQPSFMYFTLAQCEHRAPFHRLALNKYGFWLMFWFWSNGDGGFFFLFLVCKQQWSLFDRFVSLSFFRPRQSKISL